MAGPGTGTRVTRHPFRGLPDVPRILALVEAMPDSCRHVLDLPWRLSAPAIAEGRDAAYWEDADGRVIGLAAWQQPWAALDLFLLPGPRSFAIEADLFAWAEARFRERDDERGYPLPYFVEYRDDDNAPTPGRVAWLSRRRHGPLRLSGAPAR